MLLKDLKAGQSGKIITVGGEGALRQHLLDMGLIPGADVTLVKFAPMGDPAEIRIHGYELTVRLEELAKIEVEQNIKPEEEKPIHVLKIIPHPGLGEGGRYHCGHNGVLLPENQTITFALAGNQNCGKTTLFNLLTGSSQHVGNFPGVTVDKKQGQIKNTKNTLITDLPGIYSMSPYSTEEIVTREFILNEKPKCIINIVDATNIERNLYLSMQLMELGIPMVIALNMMDEVHKNGGSIRVNKMENMLGLPVIPISAYKNEGIDELLEHALHIARYQEKPCVQDFCNTKNSKEAAIHRCIHSIMHLIFDHAEYADIPLRFAACKLIEGDERIIERLVLDENELEMIEHIIIQMEKESGMDRNACIADMRFNFIKNVCSQTVVKAKESVEHARSRKIDKILTGKYTAIPSFLAIMCMVFLLTFNVFGAFLQHMLEIGIDFATQKTDNLLSSLNVNESLHSLIIDGIFSGVGSVLSFLPIIVVLFFFLSMLEDSGYIARVAFVMDKLLRKTGLSGRSIVPLLIGFGCTVPAIMASRTLASERDRKMTILLTPFMSCSAKLPVYAFFSNAFFPDHAMLAMSALYVIGIITGTVTALVMKKTIFRGKPIPFVMELPNYRIPSLKNVSLLLWEKAKDFLQKAFTVIFSASIIIWILQTFDFKFNMVSDSSESMLASIASLISPVFEPLGFGDWRICTSLITGFMAKESVVSTLTVLLGQTSIQTILTPASAFCLTVFCLLYIPCVASIAAIKRELGAKWAGVVIVSQCTIAWIVSFAFHIILSL